MGEKVLQQKLSIAEYVEFERTAEVRHEFHQGEIFAMAGGTRNHGTLGNAINTELNLICRNNPCTPFNGDVKIFLDASRRFLSPEASVVCGKEETSPYDEHAITNPILIAEVLSDTSEAYDRGEKFRLYRGLPSFKEYILIDQHRPVVNLFFKKDENIWEMQEVVGLDHSFSLQSMEGSIHMADLYRNATDLKEPYEA
ncbi:MAG: Uma2 family endonuclease [Bacteroidota bacterium]